MRRIALIAATAALFVGAAQAGDTEFIIYKQTGFQGPSYIVNGEVANLEGGFAREASSLVVKGGYWEACTDDHFKGTCHVVGPGQYPRLDRSLMDRIVSVRFLGTDTRHAKNAWNPERFASREERRDTRDDWRDERRDRRAGQAAVDLYNGPDFRGRSVRVDSATDNLRDERFDGRASSMVVHEGVWQLCTEPRFQGMCRVFGPGEYARLAELDDRVSSLRRVR